MKCNECLKELNEMTLYCDRCGAQVSKDKMKLNFTLIEKNIVPIVIESNFKEDLKIDIRNSYFLSNIRNDFKGFSKKYIDQYIDYVLLRVYYEKNKLLLTTNEFDQKKALALLETFENRKPEPQVFEILKEEYGEDFENKIIPKSITDKVEHVYCSNLSLRLISPTRFLSKIVISTLKGTLKVAIIFSLIAAALYFVLPILVNGFDILDLMSTFPYSYYIVGGVLLLLGYITSLSNRKYYPFEDIINRNATFKKHIKLDIKRRIKTLKYRMRKELRKKKK